MLYISCSHGGYPTRPFLPVRWVSSSVCCCCYHSDFLSCIKVCFIFISTVWSFQSKGLSSKFPWGIFQDLGNKCHWGKRWQQRGTRVWGGTFWVWEPLWPVDWDREVRLRCKWASLALSRCTRELVHLSAVWGLQIRACFLLENIDFSHQFPVDLK